MSNEQNVVVCDDKTEIRHELADALRQAKNLRDLGMVTVHNARTGARALQIIEDDSVAVAVLDLQMPRLDGIEVAQRIKAKNKNVHIIFFTADSGKDEFRRRAASKQIQVAQWIDKGPDFPGQVTQAVESALLLNAAERINQELSDVAAEVELTDKQRQTLAIKLAPQCFHLFSGQTMSKSVVKTDEAPPKKGQSHAAKKSATPNKDEVLLNLNYCLEETRQGDRDPAERELFWGEFRRITADELWDAVEVTDEPFRRQLAGELERAVSKIDAFILTIAHLDAAKLSLERLSSSRVAQSDVSACKKAWRNAGIETLPSFSKILEKMEEFYRAGDQEDE